MDPDANIHQFHTCKGSLNTTQACDETIDALLNKAREVSDPAQRAELYRRPSTRSPRRRNIVYLYHLNYIAAFPKNLKGYKAVPDGLIRLKGAILELGDGPPRPRRTPGRRAGDGRDRVPDPARRHLAGHAVRDHASSCSPGCA